MSAQPTPADPYRFVDDDGDYLHIGIPHTPANEGPAISFLTVTEPVHVPVERIEELITALRRLVAAQGANEETLPGDRVWQIQVQRRDGSWIDHSPATIDGREAHAGYEETVASTGHLWSYRLVCSVRTHTIDAQHDRPEEA